jgi:aromatic ring-opening dioxygenase catalytic subunit (LigB family)
MLAEQAAKLLRQAGIAAKQDGSRGFDHGVFIPFLLIYPEADIPVIQLSLKKGLDPAAHIRAGEALAPLREQGVLLVGSGMSYHNLRVFGPRGASVSAAFDDWLTEAACAPDSAQRNAALAQWWKAPSAREAHPREEHLLPLMVIAGAAGKDNGQSIFSDHVMGMKISAYRYGT